MPNGDGYSFPNGTGLFLNAVIAIAIVPGAGKWWGWVLTALAAALALASTWEAASRKEYEAVHAQHPELNRTTWVMNWALFFALPAWLVLLAALAANLRG